MSSRRLKLMAYADGELDATERAEVEAWLAEDPDAVRFANDLANLGEYVKLGHEGSADAKAIASFDIADAVMAKAADKENNVVPLKPRGRGLKVGGAVVAALALAATVALTMRPKTEVPLAQQTPVTVQPESVSEGVEVDLGETPSRSVSVYYLPSESNLTTNVVVWVDESSGETK